MLNFRMSLLWIFQTLPDNKNILTLTYIPERDEGDRVQENYQLGLFPVFYYKVDF